jgi:hypothetical protein
MLILLASNLNADILDIPEVKVYGERKVKVEPIKKQSLPFEYEYLEPSIVNAKKGLPTFEVAKKKLIDRDFGIRAEGIAGTYFGGYLLGYSRKTFYPLEVGLDFTRNSNTERSSIQIFGRAAVENFYAGAALCGRELNKPIYKFNIGNIYDLIDFNFSGIYSDTLIGVADIDLKYSPLKFNIQAGFSTNFNATILYEKYPIQAGAVLFFYKIYPELVYFLPIYDLYIKGNLLNKTGTSYFYCQSPQYLREYVSTDTYYRVELGQSTQVLLPLSLIYSHYLNNSSNFIGVRGTYREVFFEFEFPLESDYDYALRVGLSTKFSELIYANIYGYSKSIDNHFIGTDLGYEVRDNLKVGIDFDFAYRPGHRKDFDIGGYVFVSF